MLDRAVINAGPLVAFSLLDQLDLLPALFAECWVPQVVFNEVAVAGIGKLGANVLGSEQWRNRVRLFPAPDPLLVKLRSSRLPASLHRAWPLLTSVAGEKLPSRCMGCRSRDRRAFWSRRTGAA